MNYRKLNLEPGLYFVATPIGNARDITLRALDTFASVDILYAEDTRTLRKLLSIHGISVSGRKIKSLHEHSSDSVIESLVNEIRAGKSVSFSSDAGMPVVSDPGTALVKVLIRSNCFFTVVPGASAPLSALVMAGFQTGSFYFFGFLPRSSSARRKHLKRLEFLDSILVFFETPERIVKTIADAIHEFGGKRRAVICREMTKKYEDVVRGTLLELQEYLRTRHLKGELVLLIDRRPLGEEDEIDIEFDLREAMASMSLRDAVNHVAGIKDISRRKVYECALTLKAEDT
ncbi:MAG: 16S rRNA (cytidine(1402)-2'-O)-methyltransferase [Aestuariivita sp.]|nr:16S rRNA (cytidine(1402)-2'-O)-methyltransferase [Aestuariivita sp.]